MRVEIIVTAPSSAISAPAVWFIINICRGLKRDLKRLIADVRSVHHVTAPAKNPTVTVAVLTTTGMELASAEDILNIAKKARM